MEVMICVTIAVMVFFSGVAEMRQKIDLEPTAVIIRRMIVITRIFGLAEVVRQTNYCFIVVMVVWDNIADDHRSGGQNNQHQVCYLLLHLYKDNVFSGT